MIEGLRRAAAMARHQANVYLASYSADDARVLEAFAANLEREAGIAEAILEAEPTDPDVTVTAVRCPCGLQVRVPR